MFQYSIAVLLVIILKPLVHANPADSAITPAPNVAKRANGANVIGYSSDPVSGCQYKLNMGLTWAELN
jgi:hypothetical protein